MKKNTVALVLCVVLVLLSGCGTEQVVSEILSSAESEEPVISEGEELDITSGPIYDNITDVHADVEITASLFLESPILYSLDVYFNYYGDYSSEVSREEVFQDFINAYHEIFDLPKYMSDIYRVTMFLNINDSTVVYLANTKTAVDGLFFKEISKYSILHCEEEFQKIVDNYDY